MKAIRARIRGLGDTIESGWFDLSPRLNLFHFPEERGRTSFLQTLASLNPLIPCESLNPLAAIPLVRKRQGYLQKVNPAKRTVALAIFNATPEVVGNLAAVSPYLYATDRIEVGRRLDWSRWVNFVEIASSARWSEIAEGIERVLYLSRKSSPGETARVESLTQPLRGADRIKDGISRELGNWLDSLPAAIKAETNLRVEKLQQAINRAEDFHLARRIVAQHLPLFVVLSSSPLDLVVLLERIDAAIGALGEPSAGREFLEKLNGHLSALQFSGPRLHLAPSEAGPGVVLAATPAIAAAATPDSPLRRLQAATSLAIAFGRATSGTEPFLLFDCPERHLPGALHRQLGEFILTAAEFCQCGYSYAAGNIFSRHKGLPKYTVADLTAPGH